MSKLSDAIDKVRGYGAAPDTAILPCACAEELSPGIVARLRKAEGAQSAGRTAKRAGEAAEQAVHAHHLRYRLDGLAYVERIPPQVKMIRTVRGVQAVPVSGSVDFWGVLSGGQAVAIEVKHTARASLPLIVHGKSTLKPSQLETLRTVERMGGLALILVECRDGWALLRPGGWVTASAWAEAHERASVSLDVLRQCGYEIDGGDWLAAVGDLV